MPYAHRMIERESQRETVKIPGDMIWVNSLQHKSTYWYKLSDLTRIKTDFKRRANGHMALDFLSASTVTVTFFWLCCIPWCKSHSIIIWSWWFPEKNRISQMKWKDAKVTIFSHLDFYVLSCKSHYCMYPADQHWVQSELLKHSFSFFWPVMVTPAVFFFFLQKCTAMLAIVALLWHTNTFNIIESSISI